MALFLTTGYERSLKLSDMIKGIILGSLFILLTYALLPETLRFSRALILFGTAWTLFSAFLIRLLLSMAFPGNFKLEAWKRKKRIIIVGSFQESKRVFSIIRQTQVIPELIGFVDPVENRVIPDYIGHIGQIGEIVRLNRADELVFCGRDISSRQIITTMLQFTDTGLEFKIAPPESLSVIGSNSNDTAGELYILHYNTLSRLLNRRKKRMLDIGLSLLFIIISPLLILVVKEQSGLIRNVFSVLLGMNSWVGYYKSTGGHHPGLPFIRTGILTPMDGTPNLMGEEGLIEKINLNYAKD